MKKKEEIGQNAAENNKIISSVVNEEGVHEVVYQSHTGERFLIGLPSIEFFGRELELGILIKDSFPKTKNAVKKGLASFVSKQLEKACLRPLYITSLTQSVQKDAIISVGTERISEKKTATTEDHPFAKNIISSKMNKKGIHEVLYQNYCGDRFLFGFPTDRFLGEEFHVGYMITNFIPHSKEEYTEDYMTRLCDGLEQELVRPLYVIPDKNQVLQDIGQKIRKIREDKEMDAKVLAMKAGMDAANLSRIEQGKSSAGIDTLSKIATALDAKLEIVPAGADVLKGVDKMQAKRNLITRVLTEDISKLAKDLDPFYGADIYVSFEPNSNKLLDWYGKRNIATPYARELTWVFFKLRDIHSDDINYQTRYPFFDCLADAATQFLAKDTQSMHGLLIAVISAALSFEFKLEWYNQPKY